MKERQRQKRQAFVLVVIYGLILLRNFFFSDLFTKLHQEFEYDHVPFSHATIIYCTLRPFVTRFYNGEKPHNPYKNLFFNIYRVM